MQRCIAMNLDLYSTRDLEIAVHEFERLPLHCRASLALASFGILERR